MKSKSDPEEETKSEETSTKEVHTAPVKINVVEECGKMIEHIKLLQFGDFMSTPHLQHRFRSRLTPITTLEVMEAALENEVEITCPNAGLVKAELDRRRSELNRIEADPKTSPEVKLGEM